MNPWHYWFAWRPVWTYDYGWVWMRGVWRRHVPPKYGVPGADWAWDYYVRLPLPSANPTPAGTPRIPPCHISTTHPNGSPKSNDELIEEAARMRGEL